VKELVGQGTFGQVARCHTTETNTNVAVKIIKNQLAYYTQAKVEIGILHVVQLLLLWPISSSWPVFMC
jgi:dual specificity protein kinase YAK1